jgi:hypothetical protein
VKEGYCATRLRGLPPNLRELRLGEAGFLPGNSIVKGYAVSQYASQLSGKLERRQAPRAYRLASHNRWRVQPEIIGVAVVTVDYQAACKKLSPLTKLQGMITLFGSVSGGFSKTTVCGLAFADIRLGSRTTARLSQKQ